MDLAHILWVVVVELVQGYLVLVHADACKVAVVVQVGFLYVYAELFWAPCAEDLCAVDDCGQQLARRQVVALGVRGVEPRAEDIVDCARDVGLHLTHVFL